MESQRFLTKDHERLFHERQGTFRRENAVNATQLRIDLHCEIRTVLGPATYLQHCKKRLIPNNISLKLQQESMKQDGTSIDKQFTDKGLQVLTVGKPMDALRVTKH